MSYPILLILHLLAAFVFIGTVFFEIIFLSKIHHRLPREIMREIEKAVGVRAKEIIPWVLLVLFSAGIGMAWFHRDTLAHPFTSSFGTMLTLKILLAISVFCHFLTVMVLRKKGKLTGKISHRIHISVFCHVIMIVILAKGMFYFSW
ncbi:CopD family copper resistance protein [Pelistega europaea]|uniref:Integral membrane protein n=1 Tax=Pelistega europaea TaxID=106147 RepID=A0A7Y4LA79_9BURK|nr:hypothetical protein [Pelistega europaea]NOL49748.1 hypothetical protein [Pelistega europaea]